MDMLTSSPIVIPDLINTTRVGCFNRARFTFIHHAGTRTDRSLKPAMYSVKAEAWQRLSLYSEETKLTDPLGVVSARHLLADDLAGSTIGENFRCISQTATIARTCSKRGRDEWYHSNYGSSYSHLIIICVTESELGVTIYEHPLVTDVQVYIISLPLLSCYLLLITTVN